MQSAVFVKCTDAANAPRLVRNELYRAQQLENGMFVIDGHKYKAARFTVIRDTWHSFGNVTGGKEKLKRSMSRGSMQYDGHWA